MPMQAYQDQRSGYYDQRMSISHWIKH
jgi:hypothetical protein